MEKNKFEVWCIKGRKDNKILQRSAHKDKIKVEKTPSRQQMQKSLNTEGPYTFVTNIRAVTCYS